jgi:Domain of Unknown Function (DUF1206)
MTGKPTEIIDRATRSDAFEFGARAGYAVSGVLHLLVGYIILQIALGAGGMADHSGALAALAAKTGGAAMLWVAAVGLLTLALWRLAETVVGPHPSEGTDEERGKSRLRTRVKPFCLAVLYLSMAYYAVKFALGSGEPHTQRNVGVTARLMQTGWGKTMLVVVGLAIIAVGGYHVYKGITKRFMKDLNVAGESAIVGVGVTGYIAKGIVLAGAGILVMAATLTADPAKASGVDAAVKTLGGAPFGKVLLVLAAAGFAAFGLYCFVRSRHGRM